MKTVLFVAAAALLASAEAFAGCVCSDWVQRGGYCVDYIQSRIPVFPLPRDVDAIRNMGNRDVKQVEEGDVAIFDLGRYWHVAYVERVHADPQGNPVSVDVSEMNFGAPATYEELKRRWGTAAGREWRRAACCGVTSAYSRVTVRQDIPIGSLDQVWSPQALAFHNLYIPGGLPDPRAGL